MHHGSVESGFEAFMNATEAQKFIRWIIKVTQIPKANKIRDLRITDELGMQKIWDINSKDDQ